LKSRFRVKTEVHVRFTDVDKMGHVNNALYLTYFEEARVAYFKKLKGLDLRVMDGTSTLGFIVAEIGVKFLAPAFLDETLVVSIRVAEFRTKAFRFEYEIRNRKTRKLLATGYSVQVMYNYRKKRPFEIPPPLRREIEAIEEWKAKK